MSQSVSDILIVSVLPSATEIVCALGLQKYLVDISHECDYLARVAGLPTVIGTGILNGLDSKGIDEKVRALLQIYAALYHLNVDALLAIPTPSQVRGTLWRPLRLAIRSHCGQSLKTARA